MKTKTMIPALIAVTSKSVTQSEPHAETTSDARARPSTALRQARALDELRATGVDLGPLHGIPIAVKDNVDTRGRASTNGSPLFAERVPETESTVIVRLHRGRDRPGKGEFVPVGLGLPLTLFGDVANPWISTAPRVLEQRISRCGRRSPRDSRDRHRPRRLDPDLRCHVWHLRAQPTYGLVSRRANCRTADPGSCRPDDAHRGGRSTRARRTRRAG